MIPNATQFSLWIITPILRTSQNSLRNDKVQIRTGFRRTKNLKDLLVPSSFPLADQENSINSGILGCYRCHRQVCDACQNFLVPAKRIKSVTTGKSYRIMSH